MKRMLTVIIMLVVLVVGSVAGSVAGVKKIRPDELKPYLSDQIYRMSPIGVESATTTRVVFFAVVKLPKGKVVKELEYYHRGSAASASTMVYLIRSIMGTDSFDIMTSGNSQDTSNTTIPIKNEGIIEFAKIKSGYTYMIQVTSFNSYSQVKGIKITYK